MTAQDASQWYIARDGRQTGPISDTEINAIAAHGYFRASDLVWRPGFAEWTPALTVFKPPVELAPPTLPMAAPEPVPVPPITPVSQPVVSQPVTTQPAVESPAAVSAVAPREPTERPAVQAQPYVQGLAPLAPARTSAPETARLPVNPPYRTDPTQRPSAATAPPRDSTPSRDPDRTAAPARDPAFSAPSREATQPSRRQLAPVDTASEPEALPQRNPSNRGAIAALVLTLAAVGAGIWIAAYPQMIQGIGGVPTLKAIAKSVIKTDPAARQVADLDARWQLTAHWPVIKREFPDWYGDRLREAAKLANENKPDDEINKTLVDEMIALRRQNAAQALSASTPKLRVLANAFLVNLRQLKAQSITACFNFISQGEGTPGVIDQFQPANGAASPMQLQVAAIFDAIGDGRRTPVTHEKPIKADYDALMEQLSKLGWTQADVATFADPKALARAEPERVCQMVQDWFVAHISIVDEPTQERLLGETLRPVVSG